MSELVSRHSDATSSCIGGDDLCLVSPKPILTACTKTAEISPTDKYVSLKRVMLDVNRKPVSSGNTPEQNAAKMAESYSKHSLTLPSGPINQPIDISITSTQSANEGRMDASQCRVSNVEHTLAKVSVPAVQQSSS